MGRLIDGVGELGLKATEALARTGTPVTPSAHAPSVNRSLEGVRPPKSFEMSSCRHQRVDAEIARVSKRVKTRTRTIDADEKVAGVSLTLQTAEAVNP